jgi:3-isopropylmalate/(R)-2-methylmalate dehydratase small subunit
MEPFSRLRAVAAPMPGANLDTDQIIPARFLQKPRKLGMGQYLFNDLRYTDDGREQADFVLNSPSYRDARILVAERNFGCGSSREQAVYALADFGFRAAVAPSFGDIFFNNCFKSGLLPIVLAPAAAATLLALAQNMPGIHFEVDLEAQYIQARDGPRYRFELDAFRKHCLLNGVDEISLTLSYHDEIVSFEHDLDVARGWSLRDGLS